MSTGLEELPTTTAKPKIIRRIKGYCCEFGVYLPSGESGDDFARQFAFQPGCFEGVLRTGPDIALTQDLDGKTVFARTSDGSLRLTSDDHGLLVEAELRDSPQNRTLLRLIDTGRIRGWSFRAHQQWFGSSFRVENGIEFRDHRRAGLTEVTLVVHKTPRAKTRKTPIFLPLH